MRVAFVLPDLRPSGGTTTVLGHAARLASRPDFEVELVALDAGAVAGPSGVNLLTVDRARERSYDLAVATWWETARPMLDLRADRRAIFLQSFEHRFYPSGARFDQLFAESTLSLPVHFIVVATWMRDFLHRLRPDVRCHLALNGIDKETFSAPPRSVRARGPLRVLVEGQPTLWFKGVQEGLAAVRRMSEEVFCTVVALDPASEDLNGADRVVGALSAEGMAELYRENDLLLKLSRVEGLGMAPLEGFHSGLPCIVAPYTGHEEYVEHGRNGLVVGFDDIQGTAGALDLLGRDRELLGALSRGAEDTAKRWPDQYRSSDAMVSALRGIASEEPPPDGSGLLQRMLSFHAAVGRDGMARMAARADNAELALRDAQSHVRELSASRDECAELLGEAQAELGESQSRLGEIQSWYGYRAERKARAVLARLR